MQLDNPAIYECPNHKSKIHLWKRRTNGTAYCLKCNLELTKVYAYEVWEDNS